MKKTFDCVEMKRKGSQAVYEALKGKTRDEQVAYWRERNEETRKWLEERRRSAPQVPSTSGEGSD
jgi:hypothetical protein